MIAMRSDWIQVSSVAKKTDKPTRLPTRKPGIERYNRIIEAAEALILQEDLRAGDFLFNPATAVFSTTVCVTCAPGVVCKPFI